MAKDIAIRAELRDNISPKLEAIAKSMDNAQISIEQTSSSIDKMEATISNACTTVNNLNDRVNHIESTLNRVNTSNNKIRGILRQLNETALRTNVILERINNTQRNSVYATDSSTNAFRREETQIRRTKSAADEITKTFEQLFKRREGLSDVISGQLGRIGSPFRNMYDKVTGMFDVGMSPELEKINKVMLGPLKGLGTVVTVVSTVFQIAAGIWKAMNWAATGLIRSIQYVSDQLINMFNKVESFMRNIDFITSKKAVFENLLASPRGTTGFQSGSAQWNAIYSIAQATRTSVEGTADLYQRILTADIFSPETEAVGAQRLTKIINTSLTAMGTSAVEAKRAIVQFGQALTLGRLGGDDLRSLRTQAPGFLAVLRQGLRQLDPNLFGTGDFPEWNKKQLVSAERMSKALFLMEDKVTEMLANIPITFGQTVERIKNTWWQFLSVMEDNDIFRSLIDAMNSFWQTITNNSKVWGIVAQIVKQVSVGLGAIVGVFERIFTNIPNNMDVVEEFAKGILQWLNCWVQIEILSDALKLGVLNFTNTLLDSVGLGVDTSGTIEDAVNSMYEGTKRAWKIGKAIREAGKVLADLLKIALLPILAVVNVLNGNAFSEDYWRRVNEENELERMSNSSLLFGKNYYTEDEKKAADVQLLLGQRKVVKDLMNEGTENSIGMGMDIGSISYKSLEKMNQQYDFLNKAVDERLKGISLKPTSDPYNKDIEYIAKNVEGIKGNTGKMAKSYEDTELMKEVTLHELSVHIQTAAPNVTTNVYGGANQEIIGGGESITNSVMKNMAEQGIGFTSKYGLSYSS